MTYLAAVSRLRYPLVARIFHWTAAVLVLAQFVSGWTMPDVHHDTLPNGLIAWHLSIGAVLILVMVVRLAWRMTHAVPESRLARSIQLAATSVHWLLYVLLFVQLILGWGNATSRGWKIHLLGLIAYPGVTSAGSVLGHAMGHYHSVLAWLLLGLIGAHVAAALYHRVVRKDDVLQRML